MSSRRANLHARSMFRKDRRPITKNSKNILESILKSEGVTVKMCLRGIPIEEPMLAREIADQARVSKSHVYRLVDKGYMRVIPPPNGKGPKRFVGVVPVHYSEWICSIRDLLSKAGAMVGTINDGMKSVVILHDGRRKVIDYPIYRDQMETDLDLISSWLGVDRRAS